MKISQPRARRAAGAVAALPLLLPAIARAHHGVPGENFWHDVEYFLSSPAVVLLLAAVVVGAWVIFKRVRHAAGKKS